MARRVIFYRPSPGIVPITPRAGVAPHNSYRRGSKTSTPPCAEKKEPSAQTRGQTDGDKRVVVYVQRAKIDEGAREACAERTEPASVAKRVVKESILKAPGEGGGFVMAGPMTRVVAKLTDLVAERMRSLLLEMNQAALRHEKGGSLPKKSKKAVAWSSNDSAALVNGGIGYRVQVAKENAGDGHSSVWVHSGKGDKYTVQKVVIPNGLLKQFHTNVLAATAEAPERWFTLSC